MLFALVPLLVAGVAQGGPVQTSPKLGKELVINSYQLYPENIDYDAKTRLAYISVLYNSTVAVYDPFANKVTKTIAFDKLSYDPVLHSSGVQIDPLGRLSVIVNAGAAFDTRGADISGDNFLVKYDLARGRELWRYNLTAVTGGVYSGFQDIEHDGCGNAFAVGTWPSSIVRVGKDGKDAAAWYLADDADHTRKGLTGLASKGDILLATEHTGSRLLRFDMKAERGVPVVVPVGQGQGQDGVGERPDGIYLPSRFGGKVLLVSSQQEGTVVLRSEDGAWTSARRLGVVPNKFAGQGGSTTASVQIEDRIFVSTEWFGDAANKVPGTLSGNRTEFPLYDITSDVEKILG